MIGKVVWGFTTDKRKKKGCLYCGAGTNKETVGYYFPAENDILIHNVDGVYTIICTMPYSTIKLHGFKLTLQHEHLIAQHLKTVAKLKRLVGYKGVFRRGRSGFSGCGGFSRRMRLPDKQAILTSVQRNQFLDKSCHQRVKQIRPHAFPCEFFKR